MVIPKSELAISLLMLVSSTIASLLCYSHIILNRTNNSVLVSNLPADAAKYQIIYDDHCVGTYHHSLFVAENNYELRGNATLRASWNGATLTPILKIEATFNSLGQLGVSLFQLSIGADQISFGTNDISPISGRFRSFLSGVPYVQNVTLPGPIELKSNDADSYRIEYPRASEVLPSTQHLSANPISQLVRIHTEKVDSFSTECLAGTDQVNLNDIADRTKGLFAIIGKLAPSALTEF